MTGNNLRGAAIVAVFSLSCFGQSYPTSTATDRTLVVAKDRLTNPGITAGINASTLSIPVPDGSLFTAYEVIRLDDEQVQICSIVGNTLTACERGYCSTTAAAG